MINLKKLAGGVAFMAVATSLTPAAYSQVTTSGVQGTVTTADGAAAGDAGGVMRIARHAKGRGAIGRAIGPFMHVCLAKDDGTGGTQVGDHGRVLIRRRIGQRVGTGRGRKIAG